MKAGREQLNRWTLREYCKHCLMILMKVPIWCVQWLLFWIPVKKDRIVVYSLKQRGYSCNLKYLTEYLRTYCPERFEVLWVVRSDEERKLLEARGIPAVTVRSMAHLRYRHRAGIVITNDEFYPMCVKRRGQLYINTWHGAINYKKIGYEGLEFTNPIQRLIYRMNNPCPDCFVSGSRSFTQTTSRSFRFPEKVFLECGLPRNDVLVKEPDGAALLALREKLGLKTHQKAVLYAPTFRKGKAAPEAMPDFERLTETLSERFGGEWMVLLRQHYFVAETAQSHPRLIDVSTYEDMQELILCSDCMISDYSSCMWDFILTGKPCFVYAEDLDAYRNSDRSFFIPPESWPYPMATDADSLYRQIRCFDAEDFRRRAAEHLETYGSHDRGTACDTLIKVLERKEK